MSKSKPDKPVKKTADAKEVAKASDTASKPADGGWRETVESIAMAVILALLFRGFVAEAFVIPTGSMAPTLQGRHKDVTCPQCLISYQATASEERSSTGQYTGEHVVSTTCPVCRYTQNLQLFDEPNDHSFSGDRIIVGKFSYDFAEPQRWDVIVFKFPGNAVDNYIKRLIGLPGETIQIVGGNILAGPSEDKLAIVRKPPHKLAALLQLVDDTQHIPQSLIDVDWPARWQESPAVAGSAESAWTTADGGRQFTCAGKQPGDAWLRYRHLVPSYQDWKLVLDKRLPSGVKDRPGQLIADYYAYNTSRYIREKSAGDGFSAYLKPGRYFDNEYDPEHQGLGSPPPTRFLGQNWVDDLAVEAAVEVAGSQGELLLMLVRGGAQYRCRIDVATGKATLSIQDKDGEPLDFDGPAGEAPVAQPAAETALKGPGSYRVRLSNCDNQVLLWVNGSLAKFSSPTTYYFNPQEPLVVPHYSPGDPGDLAPAGVGSRGLELKLTRLQILRDKYYIATGSTDFISVPPVMGEPEDYAERILSLFGRPDLWSSTGLFEPRNRHDALIVLDEDQFLPMGDNSPASFDGRFWTEDDDSRFRGDHRFVERELLIGKALLIYWPHTWNRPIPFTPNFRKMGPIR